MPVLATFTKTEIRKFYRLSRSITEVTDGFAITPHSPTEGREALIIPRQIPITIDTGDPIDLTTPFSRERISELLRALGIHGDYLRDTYAASLRFGSHWTRGRRSYFQILDPLKADAMQILLLQEKPDLNCGWMDLPSSAEDRLERLATYSYYKACPNSMVLHGFIINCDHESEPIQLECSREWQGFYD